MPAALRFLGRSSPLTHVVLRPLVRNWHANIVASYAGVSQPRDSPRASVAGDPWDHVLVVGGGPALGLGVGSHGLALPGSLARALSRRTGRGVVVRVVPDAAMTANSALGGIADLELPSTQVLVLTLGLTDAFALTPVGSWRADLEKLVRGALAAMPDGAEVFVLGATPPSSVTHLRGLLVRVVDRHVARLNEASARACRTVAGAQFVPFEPPVSRSPARYFRTPADFANAAAIIADAIAPSLDGQHAKRAEAHTLSFPELGDEAARQQAVEAMRVLDTPPEEIFDTIVGLARRAFRTESAALSIIDGHREWHKARTHGVAEEVPRSSSFCSMTIQGWNTLVVPDALDDDRFAGNPQVIGGPGIRFYAGYPIRSPSGLAVGALCVFDPQPRQNSDVDRLLLRELALLAERELWKRAD